ncbi:hypothetical protein QYH69_32370 [Paraburkholderia sp. SARCC-3016]|uniref:hypothetical protein n=1 Tax=Paraburkholderia sp. SARCC-3016 TaxID=3058611 RepID=UPI0028069FD3|nr:hypothetical protein [Paraburkholderia sp. SARCC-3016]MDQ7981920.1 hypothetical protein [Paraburkholderia sp. SARCC-3016]
MNSTCQLLDHRFDLQYAVPQRIFCARMLQLRLMVIRFGSALLTGEVRRRDFRGIAAPEKHHGLHGKDIVARANGSHRHAALRKDRDVKSANTGIDVSVIFIVILRAEEYINSCLSCDFGDQVAPPTCERAVTKNDTRTAFAAHDKMVAVLDLKGDVVEIPDAVGQIDMDLESPVLDHSVHERFRFLLEGCPRFEYPRASGKKAVVMDLSRLPTKSGANNRFSSVERFSHCRVPQLSFAFDCLGALMWMPDAAFDDRRRIAAIVKVKCRDRKGESANMHCAAVHAYLRGWRRFVSLMRIQRAATGGTPDGMSRCCVNSGMTHRNTRAITMICFLQRSLTICPQQE